MTYDYYIAESPYDGALEVEDADSALIARLYRHELRGLFIAGASALGLSVYDRDARHGLCGTLEQTMHEGEK